MKSSGYIIAGMLLLGVLVSPHAEAHGRGYWGGWGNPGFSFSFGVPLGYPPYNGPYLYQPYYYPPVYQAPPAPPVYIEPPSAPAYNTQSWYYCASADRYYPEVGACPEGWQSVSPYPGGEAPGYWYYCDDPAGYYPYVDRCYRPWRRMNP